MVLKKMQDLFAPSHLSRKIFWGMLCFCASGRKIFLLEGPSGTFSDLALFQVLGTGHFLSDICVCRATMHFRPEHTEVAPALY